MCEISTPPGFFHYCSLFICSVYWPCSAVQYSSILCVSVTASIILGCVHCLSTEGSVDESGDIYLFFFFNKGESMISPRIHIGNAYEIGVKM